MYKGDVYICLDCGLEYQDKIPFPNPCKCGNICEEFYRLKDRYDKLDEADKKPLQGVKYNADVLLTKYQDTAVIKQPVNPKIEINFNTMSKKELSNYLKTKGITLDARLAKDRLVAKCKEVEG